MRHQGERSRFLPVRAALPLVFASALSACAITNGDLTQQLVGTDEVVTSSVSTATSIDGVDATDAMTIKGAVINLSQSGAAPPASWSNAETGSSGTIVALNAFKGQHGQDCRSFRSTVDTYKGISFFNGETCEIGDGQWVLSWLKPVD